MLSPLVLEYAEDWRGTLAEFHRALRAGGHLVFSVTHPLFDHLHFKADAYFRTGPVSAEWRGFGGTRVRMPSFRRSLEGTINTLLEAGFRPERILEPRVTEDLREGDPKHCEELSRQPCFLCVRVRK